MYLQDTHTAFNSNESISLGACSYLHNYISHPNDEIFSEKFSKALDQQPIFTADDVDKFRAYLCSKLSKGAGMEILEKVEQSKYKPSKLLMDHVCQIIREKSEYILLDEQLIVYDKVLTLTKKGLDHQKKSVIIVKGGPGTGKSVIAINLMADLLRNGYNTHYATGSKAFTETLRKKIGVRGSAQFKYFNSYATANPNEIDVLIADEAHRIRETSNSRFTKKILRSDMPQIEELIRISKLGVFLLMISKMFAQMRLDHQNI
jgi:replicative DNA helicase